MGYTRTPQFIVSLYERNFLPDRQTPLFLLGFRPTRDPPDRHFPRLAGRRCDVKKLQIDNSFLIPSSQPPGIQEGKTSGELADRDDTLSLAASRSRICSSRLPCRSGPQCCGALQGTDRRGISQAMSIRVSAGVVLMMAASTIVWAQRPLTYPLRSQSPGQQSVDNAYCYGQAKLQTGVDTARQPQRPFRATPIQFAPDAAHGTSEPPLPASTGQAGAASAGVASAGVSAGASQAVASGPAASGTSAASGPSVATTGSASAPNLPPLPPPEPPMVAYWRVFGDCMQSRGYGVR